MRTELVHDPADFGRLAAEWDELARAAGAGLFLSHRWLAAWWRAFHGVDELWVLLLRDEGSRLRAAWPLHLRAPRSGAIKVGELRVVGELGVAQRSLLGRTEDLDLAAEAFTTRLCAERGWDLLEVPLASRRVGDALDRALGSHGQRAQLEAVVGRPYVELAPAAVGDFIRTRRPSRTVPGAVFAPANLDVPHAVDELLRLLRREWAAREAASLAADPQATQFLHEILPTLHAEGLARLGMLGLGGAGAIAADLVVFDGARHVQLLRGADPDHALAGAAEQLTFGSIETSFGEAARRFELADEDSCFKTGRSRILRLRLWNGTAAGRLHRGVVSLRGAMRGGEPSAPALGALARSPLPWRALERLKEAAPEAARRAVARLATYATLHLYRGELFARDVSDAGGLTLRLFSAQDFERLTAAERDAFVTRLDLQQGYCRQKWERGDLVVLAEAGRSALEDGAAGPLGIVWCARAPVYVPDIGREVRPGSGECYIHDVYVHPDRRGRQVAPAMLDFLARELRGRDVYRAWALIERSNVASTRAFEKADYASVADVVYAKMGLAARLTVRPPDPEARAFLGLP